MKEPIFSYMPGTSFLHGLDPRTKLVAVMFLGALSFKAENFMCIVALFLLFLALALISRIPFKSFTGAIRPMWLFIAFIFLAQLFLSGGKPFETFFFLQPSLKGLEKGAELAARFILLLLFAALLTASTSPSAITAGIERLLRPFPLHWFGITSFELATMMNLSIAFLPSLFERMERTKAAQTSRGLDFGKNPLKSVTALAIPLLAGIFRDTEELALAMESRGYQGKARTSMYEFSMKRKDWLSLLFVLIFSILLLRL
jgi:energy-coupling factor transport system permease protein